MEEDLCLEPHVMCAAGDITFVPNEYCCRDQVACTERLRIYLQEDARQIGMELHSARKRVRDLEERIRSSLEQLDTLKAQSGLGATPRTLAG
jgi:hypothetical protein